MTKLQEKALEHVDGLLINVHNGVLNITDMTNIEALESEAVGYIATRGRDLAKEIHEIQMWCRLICSDPQSK